MSENESTAPSNFIRTIIDKYREDNKNDGRVVTRFPPEPNGYLHIGHAKSICLNFGIAKDYEGACHLRFDDTNPVKEDTEYVDAIKDDIRWLGFDWKDNLFFASDYFEQLYDFAATLIKKGKAYVCELTAEEMRTYRGTLTEPGKDSPYRDRSVEENLELFKKMRAGDFDEGHCLLRAKIDMASPNLNLRDPALYRIRKVHHHRTGDAWSIYPMYDFAHGLSDAIEGITHSICTLEFEDHRPLYNWFLETLETKAHPQQIEFARLNLTETVMSKRFLKQLVDEGHVSGWDDPRMPTIVGMRRRGYTAAAIRDFCDRIGVAKGNSTVDVKMLNFCLREDLNNFTIRVMAVLDPIKVVIENYPEGDGEMVEFPNHPADESMGKRNVPFSREIYIERDDFREVPFRKYRRLAPGKEVRLRYAYYVTCTDMIKDENGKLIELRCTYDPESRGGDTPDGRRVRGTIHWVSVPHAVHAEVRHYAPLLLPKEKGEKKDFIERLNPDSLTLLKIPVEPSLKDIEPGTQVQFERKGYYCADKFDSKPGKPVFNQIVNLRDSFAKVEKKMKEKK